MPSLTGTSPSPSPSASTDGQSDTLEMLCAVLGFIWLMVAAMYTSWSVLTILDKRRDTHTTTTTAAADKTKVVVMRAPRTRFTARLIWAVLKGLLWPLVVLWELVDMMVTEWCVCSTCDTTDCWRKCADACEELSREPGEPGGPGGPGDDHVHRGAARQTAQSEGVVVRSPPLAMESMEMLPTYQEATMPAGLSERKGN